jgi:hypothetical protein
VSSPSGKSGSGEGLNTPSNNSTASSPASGRRPLIAGYLETSASRAASRRTTTAPSALADQITGSDPTRSSASDLPGFTKDSLVGRHWCAMCSSAVAASSKSSSPILAIPSRSASTSSGIAAAQNPGADGDTDVAIARGSMATNGPRTMSASGEPGDPMPA